MARIKSIGMEVWCIRVLQCRLEQSSWYKWLDVARWKDSRMWGSDWIGNVQRLEGASGSHLQVESTWAKESTSTMSASRRYARRRNDQGHGNIWDGFGGRSAFVPADKLPRPRLLFTPSDRGIEP